MVKASAAGRRDAGRGRTSSFRGRSASGSGAASDVRGSHAAFAGADGAPGALQPLEDPSNPATYLDTNRSLCFPIPTTEVQTNPNLGK